MAIAVFGDIHGNLEALEAILTDIKRKRRKYKIEQIFFLGDAITFGPNSNECIKLLEKNKVKCIVGNHEQRMVQYGKNISAMAYAGTKHLEYVFNSLDDDSISFIKTMSSEITIDYKGKNILFTHFGHDNDGAVKPEFKVFSESKLDKILGRTNFDVVFFGHVHIRKIIINESGKSYCCLGSSGCVKGDQTFYTYFDVNTHMAQNYDIYRIDVAFNRKRFEEKMINEPIPDKIQFAKSCFGMNLASEAPQSTTAKTE